MAFFLKMIINKGTINTIAITVTEQTTISNPYYLFEFVSKQSKVFVYCIARPTTTTRYDNFSIEERSSANPLLGQVSLAEGEYAYNIYQQSSSTNLDPSLTTPAAYNTYVETGVLVVPSAGDASTEYSGATTTNTVYNG